MSSIDDEIVRAKMRKLRVSTFADIFYEVGNDEAYADALPEDIFLAAVEEAYTQRQQRNIAKAMPTVAAFFGIALEISFTAGPIPFSVVP